MPRLGISIAYSRRWLMLDRDNRFSCNLMSPHNVGYTDYPSFIQPEENVHRTSAVAFPLVPHY